MKYEKSCGAIVINDDKILVVTHNAGHVGFPKGHVEAGETEEETAIREVKEETGIDIEVDTTHRYLVHYSPRENVEKDVVFFLGKVVGGELKPQYEEVSAAYFLPIDQVMEKLQFDNIQKMFAIALEDIKKLKGIL